MKALIDTNVALDFLQARDPFAGPARAVFELAAEGAVEAHVTAKQAADIFYVASRELHSKAAAAALLKKLLRLVSVVDATGGDVYRSLLEGYADFEDGMLAEAARRLGLDAIVTRDARGFATSPVPAFAPAALVDRLSAGGE